MSPLGKVIFGVFVDLFDRFSFADEAEQGYRKHFLVGKVEIRVFPRISLLPKGDAPEREPKPKCYVQELRKERAAEGRHARRLAARPIQPAVEGLHFGDSGDHGLIPATGPLPLQACASFSLPVFPEAFGSRTVNRLPSPFSVVTSIDPSI